MGSYEANFEDMGLSENLLRGIIAYGFERPSEIQSRGILPIIHGGDLIAQSQSGTGKTGTFSIGSLQRIDEKRYGCQVIIIAPTRELSTQIANVCSELSQYMNVNVVVCVGGDSIEETRQKLNIKKPTVVVGTPGRITDLIERRYIRLDNLKLVVLDEADELLSNSFERQIRKIIGFTSKNVQICIFSATLPPSVLAIAERFLFNPTHVLVKQEELTLDGISQFYINTGDEKYKFDTFYDIYNIISVCQTIVYVNSKQTAEMLRDKLMEKNFPVSVIHSQMAPVERSTIMKQFRSGTTRILISTDLTSRGIDIQSVSVVINYEVPNPRRWRNDGEKNASYIHRIGRSGRFGRKGVAINIVTNNDMVRIKELERYYRTQIEELPQDIQSYLN